MYIYMFASYNQRKNCQRLKCLCLLESSRTNDDLHWSSTHSTYYIIQYVASICG